MYVYECFFNVSVLASAVNHYICKKSCSDMRLWSAHRYFTILKASYIILDNSCTPPVVDRVIGWGVMHAYSLYRNVNLIVQLTTSALTPPPPLPFSFILVDLGAKCQLVSSVVCSLAADTEFSCRMWYIQLQSLPNHVVKRHPHGTPRDRKIPCR